MSDGVRQTPLNGEKAKEAILKLLRDEFAYEGFMDNDYEDFEFGK